MVKIIKTLIFSLLAIVFIVSVISWPVNVSAALSSLEKIKMEALRESLEKSPNFTEYTAYKMLKFKSGDTERDYSEYRLRPRGASPLSREFSASLDGGGSPFSYEGLDLLTGERAIDESLQLGSIGRERGVTGNLSQEELLNISEIEPLDIDTHPWEAMIGDAKPVVPSIFSLVPNDHFMVYLNDMEKFTQLEEAISSLEKPLKQIYNIGDAERVREMIFERLQISELDALRKFVDQAVFTSYNLDLIVDTDYALILKLKSEQFEKFVNNFVQGPQDRRGKVGEYYVIATDPAFYQKIVGTKSNPTTSLAQSPDLKYILSLYEQEYDNFVYLSEAFIQRLTGPAYRINTRRRNTISQALETLQYTTFAYRVINGKWPTSFQQIINKGYIAKNSIANIEDYSIGSDGVVQHKAWNTLYNITPVARVPITKVTAGEEAIYERFSNGYQGFWREFIDPVGVAVLVGDQIRFHTIILPLIDETQYNWLGEVAGGEAIQFDFIFDSDFPASMQLVTKLNIDDIVYEIYKDNPREFDENYQRCRDDYYDQYDSSWFTNPENNIRERPSLSDVCKPEEASKEEGIKLVKEKIADTLDWKSSKDILGFIGNEATLAAGESFNFEKIEDFSTLDAYLGLELEDTGLAEKFLEHLFAWFSKESGGSGGFYGSMLGVRGMRPIKNSYNGVTFYVVPTGFINLYYAFLNDRLYITVSQMTMNKLIDGKQSEITLSNHLLRAFDYLGPYHNIALILDGDKIQGWVKALVQQQWTSYGNRIKLERQIAYYVEALALANTLPQYDGTIENVERYYTHFPEKWFEAVFATRSGKCYVSVGDVEWEVFNKNRDKAEDNIDFEDIIDHFSVDQSLLKLEGAESFGVGLTLTEEGLDARIVFNNPSEDKFDPRITAVKEQQEIDWLSFLPYIAIGALIIIAGAVVIIVIKRRRVV